MRNRQALRPFGMAATACALPSPRGLEAAVRREALVLLRGLPAMERDEFLAWCRSFPGPGLLEWESGPVMEMREVPGAANYLFSRERVPFHWDGAFHRVPSFLVFYCVEAPHPGAGGETLFCDTRRVWEAASAAEQELWSRVELTYETAKLAHYGGKVTGPLLAAHPASGAPVLRFAEPVETALNPVTLTVTGVPEAKGTAFLAAMRRRIYDPAYCYRHAWRQGDLLLADNHALIHGRTAFRRDCPRHLRRIQLL